MLLERVTVTVVDDAAEELFSRSKSGFVDAEGVLRGVSAVQQELNEFLTQAIAASPSKRAVAVDVDEEVEEEEDEDEDEEEDEEEDDNNDNDSDSDSDNDHDHE